VSQMESQSLTNHARLVPGFHYGVVGALSLNFLWSLVRLDENLTDRREIKRRIREWQADHFRV